MANTNAVEPITLTGANVTSAIDAYVHSASFGKDAVFAHGRDMEAEAIDNNNVRIRDGLLSNQGHFLRIKPGQYENLTVSSGVQGEKRCDSIVAEFKVDAVGEKHEIKIIKGKSGVNETPPVLIVEDLENGGTTRQMELYRIHLEGINVVKIERVANYVGLTYSKEESWTGKYYFDGKKIYVKQIEFSFDPIGKATLTHNLGIDKYLSVNGYCKVYKTETHRPVPFINETLQHLAIQTLNENSIGVYSSFTGNSMYLCVEYTKQIN